MNIIIVLCLSVLFLLTESAGNWSELVDLHPPTIPSHHSDSAASYRMTGPYQVGVISFQSIMGYSVESDEDSAIYVSSPQGEFGVVILPVAKEYFQSNIVPYAVGGQFPEESLPIEMFYYLGYENIRLESLQPYWHQGFLGYRREFKATSIQGDLMEGEYIFYQVNNFVFIAIGSAVRENFWEHQGKEVFDILIGSVQFPLKMKPLRPLGGIAISGGILNEN